MRVTRAIIPHMRKNRQGTIIQIASMGGRVTFPLYSIYHGTKWAVEGFSEALHYELEPFNIKIKIIEPGAIKTEFYGRSRAFVKPQNTSDYDDFVTKCDKVSGGAAHTGEDPEVVAKEIFKAANDQSKKLRYTVGKPAPLLVNLRKFIPDSLYFRLVKSSYKI